MSDKAREKGRLAIYGLAGFYILYMAYSIFKGISDSAGLEQIALLVAMVAFVIIGIGLVVFSLVRGYKISKADYDQEKNKENENNK
ncbi:hypothetical protein [Faecalimonas sp.]